MNGEIQSRIGEENLASQAFKFEYPASLNPRFTTILHLCAIEVVLKLSTKLYGITSGSQITSILQNSTIPDNKWSKFSFLPFKEVEEISHFRVYTSWVNATSALTTISALWVQVWVVHYGYTWLT